MNRKAIVTIYVVGCFLQWGYFVNRPERMFYQNRRDPAELAMCALIAATFWPLYWPLRFAKYLTRP